MSNIPIQTRTIDPYSSYGSNVVNQLTRMVTRGENCISGSPHSLDVNIDSTSPTTCLVLSDGICYKDDVIIEITSEMTIDMSDVDFYLTTDHFDEAGYYYITLKYTYVKAKPAPEAEIVVLRPSETSLFANGGYIFLKAVDVAFIGGTFQIQSAYDYDPADLTIKREFTKLYFSIENQLPTFLASRDEGRAVYVQNLDEIYFGTSQKWESLSPARVSIDTTGCYIAQLIYVGTDGKAYPAIATNPATFADGAVIGVGLESTGDGKVRLYGPVENVPIETGITINIGDKIYLSEKEAGTVTNYISQPYAQHVGTCVYVSGSICNIWFIPGIFAGIENSGYDSIYDKYQDLLVSSIYGNLFVDSFINDDYVNTTVTTATINATEYKLVGETGELFESASLIEPSFSDSTCLVSCQISANISTEANITWYVSNNGNSDWEYLVNGLDAIHTFSTVDIPVSAGGGDLTVGEWVEGSISGKRAIVNAHTAGTNVLLSQETGSGNWIVGETLTGDDSGSIITINDTAVERTNMYDIRVYCVWTGSSSISDYGVLYNVDEDKDETSNQNELNIETLYADIYEVPSLTNDGQRGYPFNDTVAIPDLAIVSRTSTITGGIVELANYINDLELFYTPGVGEFVDGDTTPSVAEKYQIYKTCEDSTANITITLLDGAVAGQKVDIVHSVASYTVTIQNNTNMHLQSAGDFVMGQYDVISLEYISATIGWVEKSRSNN